MFEFVKNIFTGKKGVLGGIADVADRFITTKAEKQEFLLEVERLLHQKEKDVLADVQSARLMQAEALKQTDKFSKRYIYYLTSAALVFGFAYIFFVTFSEIPPQNQRFADTILGVVISLVFGSIFSFFYGTRKVNQNGINELLNTRKK